MANRYWVTGGSGSWNNTNNWSTATGGASGASVPSTADAAIFDASSGAGTATLDISPTVQTVNLTGFTGTLAFGTNNISVNSTGTVWTQTTSCSITGTPVVNVTNTSSTAITLSSTSVTQANSVSFNVANPTGTITAGGVYKNLDFTGFTGTLANSTRTIYGNVKFSSGMTLTSGTLTTTFAATSGTQQITCATKTLDFPVTWNGAGGTFQLQDDFTLATGRKFTCNAGTLDLNNKTLSCGLFDANAAGNVRTLAFGTTGQISCTGTGTVWQYTGTNLTITGTPVVNITSTGSTAITCDAQDGYSYANSLSYNFTGGTYPLTFFNTIGGARNLDFTGYAGTWGGISATNTVFGNLTFSSGMSISAGASIMTFGLGGGGTKVITTNNKTLDFPITITGVGNIVQLQDALTMGSTRTLTLTNGTLDLNGKTLTVGTAFTTATGTKNLTFNGGTLVCPTASTTAFNNAVPTGFTTTAGTGTGVISMTAATAKTFVGGGSTFNCTLQNSGAGALTVSGSNTFTTISNSVQPTTFTFTSGTTQTLTNWSVNGTAGNLVTIGASTTSAATLSKSSGTVSSDYLSISYSTASGGATWNAGANSTDGGNNTGWIFTAGSTGNFLIFF